MHGQQNVKILIRYLHYLALSRLRDRYLIIIYLYSVNMTIWQISWCYSVLFRQPDGYLGVI